jgi:hypothetical protein
MSKLKIANLSFCETDIDSSRKVRGGNSDFNSLLSYYRSKFGNFSSAIGKSDVESLKKSFAKRGYKVSYGYDDATGGYSLAVSKKEDKKNAYSGATKSYFYNGKSMSSYSSASM